MKTRLISVGILLILVLTQTGCWDRTEIDEMAYVVAVGVDNLPDDPEYSDFTFQIIIPSKLTGGGSTEGGGGGGKPFYTTVIRAKSSLAAMDQLEAEVSRRMTLIQCRAYLFGEFTARKGLLPFVRLVTRDPEFRLTSFAAVIRGGTAKEFMESINPKLEANPVKYYQQFAWKNEHTGFSSESDFKSFVAALETGGEEPLLALASVNKHSLEQPLEEDKLKAGLLPKTGGSNYDWMGVAVFKQDKLVGELGKSETEVLSLIRDDWRHGNLIIPDPHSPLPMTFMISASGPKVDADIAVDPTVINVKLEIEATLIAQFSGQDYTEEPKKQELQQLVSAKLESDARALVEKAQNEFRADIFRFGNTAVKKKFLTWKQWQEFDWVSKFPEAEINITADVTVVQFGSHTKPADPYPGGTDLKIYE